MSTPQERFQLDFLIFLVKSSKDIANISLDQAAAAISNIRARGNTSMAAALTKINGALELALCPEDWMEYDGEDEESEAEEEEEEEEMVEEGTSSQPQEDGETDDEDVIPRKRVRQFNDLFRGTTSREATSLEINTGRANESGSRRRLYVSASRAGSSARRSTRRQSPRPSLTPSPCSTLPPSLLVPFTPSPPVRMASDEVPIIISSSSDEERESDAVLERDPFAINNCGLAAIEDVPSTSGNETVVPLERNAMELRRKLVEKEERNDSVRRL